MSLLSSWSEDNEVVNTALNVKYSVDTAVATLRIVPASGKGKVIYSDVTYYKVARYARKQYEYVGMDEETAMQCQSEKISQYTRSYSRIVENLSADEQGQEYITLMNRPTTACTSDVAAVHQAGSMWKVSINVNEIDEKVAFSPPSSPASMFGAENARDYD